MQVSGGRVQVRMGSETQDLKFQIQNSRFEENSKLQIPNSKFKTPNSKLKFQRSRSRSSPAIVRVIKSQLPNPDSWKIDQTLSQLIKKGLVPPLIVIGVDHMGVSRSYEYLPYKDTVSNPDTPEPAGKQFPEFLARDVLPIINNRYRISKGAQTIGGSSYGGIAARQR